MKRMRGRNDFVAINVDLEKAYDCLVWEFIEDTHAHSCWNSMSFAFNYYGLRNYPSMQVLWNWEPTEAYTV